MSEGEEGHLIAITKGGWGTRHMSLRGLQLGAGLGHVVQSTVFNTLHARGVKAYVEECKFILNEENMKWRIVCDKLDSELE